MLFGEIEGGSQGSRNHAATGWRTDTSNTRNGREEETITRKGYLGRGGEGARLETTMPLCGLYTLPPARKVAAW